MSTETKYPEEGWFQTEETKCNREYNYVQRAKLYNKHSEWLGKSWVMVHGHKWNKEIWVEINILTLQEFIFNYR